MGDPPPSTPPPDNSADIGLSKEEMDPRAPGGFIVGIQEPHFKFKKIPGLRGHKLLIDSNHEEPRAAIYYSRNLDIWGCGELTNRDMVTGIYTTPHGQKIYISSIYMPHEAK